MALKFNCGVCGKTIIIYLRAGEKVKCAGCGSAAIVSWDATTTNEKPDFTSAMTGPSAVARATIPALQQNMIGNR